MVKIAARAKLNLFLEVTGRRPDGYHDLATLFARIGVADALTLKRSAAPGITLKVEGGPALGKPGDNIVCKAAEKFFAAFKIRPAVEIKLKKNIPVGAGLGGGSSDGAAALLGLAKLYRIPRSAFPRLMKIAAAIGSDVPFFMIDEIMAVGRGRGEKLKPLKPAGRLPYIVLVYPGVPVYTREVYGNLKLGAAPEIKARLKEFGELCSLIKKGGFAPGLAGRLFNRLEDPVLPRHRAVRLAKARLAALGADAALMSGSGACVFGLCRGRAKAAAIARELGCIKSYRVFLTKFC
ncbi:MAG: 4-(cytidine 5'-diphospho)-2-C-methyl-D-erythritol kinase [Elusimicrobia bacterium HGW-Elusimicrobia-3]|nr:MAG: 4-(cytidine 5'-diphospho)-2-C-methyl-D-erythritol kinase [Elusimicrobia bacterium HGW-Elusimicrobia-3]